MATQTLDMPSIITDVLDWIDRTFGYEQTQEFAQPIIETGDAVIVSGVLWRVISKAPRCPYLTLPAEYADYALDETWLYVYNVGAETGIALTDYVPERYLIALIEMGE